MATVPTPDVPTPDVQLNQTGRILLGLIAEGHDSGYSIKAEIERSTRFFWGASAGGIYPELRRLTAAGLVSVRDDPRGDAVRHSYELTDAGRAALHAWLVECAGPVLEMRDEGLLRLRFAAVLAPDERLSVLRAKRAAHEERIASLESRLAEGGFDDRFHRLTAEYGLGWNQWARDWCIEQEKLLAADGA
jgi:PadR family transcriptional regulator, regulatory protein AphA